MKSHMDVKRWLGTFGLLGAVTLAGCATGTAASRTEGTGKASAQAGQAQPPPTISTRAQLRFEDAIKALEAQRQAGVYDWVALEQKFSAALDEDADLAEAEFNLGVIAERQGKPDVAAQRYRAALAKKPSLRQAGHNLAVLSLNAGNTAGAVTIYQQMLERAPDDAVALAGLADIYRQQGDHEQALRYARQALVREPQTLAAFKVMMKSYLERKQLGLARLVAQRALKVDQKDPEVYLVIGQILLAEGQPEKARVQFKLAVQHRADFLPAHTLLARMALEDGDYAGAEEHLRRLLQADGRNAEAHLNLGVAYRGQGQADKAMLEYDAAEQLNPRLAAIYLNRAILLHRVKDAPERAIELYKKYLSMAEGDFVVTADSPVFALLKEAEQMVAAKAEAQRMEEEERRKEAAQAAQAEKMKAAEKAGGAQVAPAAGRPGAEAAPAKSAPAKPAPARSSRAKAAAEASDEPSDEPKDLP